MQVESISAGQNCGLGAWEVNHIMQNLRQQEHPKPQHDTEEYASDVTEHKIHKFVAGRRMILRYILWESGASSSGKPKVGVAFFLPCTPSSASPFSHLYEHKSTNRVEFHSLGSSDAKFRCTPTGKFKSTYLKL